MPNSPSYVKLDPEETVVRRSKCLGFGAILWFDDNGKIYTKKPCNGEAYLTNQRLIFEGQELASAWQNLAFNLYWPSSFFLQQEQLIVAINLNRIVDISLCNQIRAEPIKVVHIQNDLPSPTYLSVSEKNNWIREIQASIQLHQFPSTDASTRNALHPPTDFQQLICPTCGKPLSYIELYQRWYCFTEKKYV